MEVKTAFLHTAAESWETWGPGRKQVCFLSTCRAPDPGRPCVLTSCVSHLRGWSYGLGRDASCRAAPLAAVPRPWRPLSAMLLHVATQGPRQRPSVHVAAFLASAGERREYSQVVSVGIWPGGGTHRFCSRAPGRTRSSVEPGERMVALRGGDTAGDPLSSASFPPGSAAEGRGAWRARQVPEAWT